MKLWLAIPLLATALVFTSCLIRPKTSAAKTPATPMPAPAQTAPPAPPAPISSPQTEIQLPPAQPVSAEALATIQTIPDPTEPAPELPAKAPAHRPAAAPAASPKAESGTAVTAEPPPVQGPPTPVPAPAEEQPRLQPVYSEEDRRRILADIEKRKVEVEGLLRGVSQSRISQGQRGVVDSIRSLMNMTDDTAKRGDLRSAALLSERALILARELASGR